MASPVSARYQRVEVIAATAGFCAVPLSIAVAEIFLVTAFAIHLLMTVRQGTRVRMPQVYRWWLLWAALELASWIYGAHWRAGAGEIRHLALIGSLFCILPVVALVDRRMTIWRGIFVTSSVGSASLVIGFVVRAIRYRHDIAAGGDPAFYLRTGGLLHHWMIYAVVEVLVFGALLQFHRDYPEERWWSTPALAIHGLAICLSLTRTLWLACFLLLAIHLILRRSKWTWALPLVPALAFLLAPGPIKTRVADSLRPDYSSNAERVQMWGVGWKMIREHPLAGVGPGRVESLYVAHLPPGAPVPDYHGHLHNDTLQLAAQFGLPVLVAALLCLIALVRILMQEYRRARGRDERFLCSAALMGLSGFLVAGLTDYAYGHALGIILFSFVVLGPAVSAAARPDEQALWSDHKKNGPLAEKRAGRMFPAEVA